ncbi:hypothetical protein JCM16303_000567 [Sporobolomyces ruberrimus]
MDILELVHEERAVAQRPFVCNYSGCPKGFARKSDLVRHERIHTNERPWNCNWPGCKRDFIQRSALVVHMRTHTGERPHRCEYHGCDKAFSDSSSLARHRRIHTGKRPYMCAVRNCLKTFCRKTTLTKHIKKNHPQYAHTPDAVSLASFGPETPQLGYTPSIGGDSLPQTPSDAGRSDDEMDDYNHTPGSYSYFPPQQGQHPSYPSSSKLNLRSRGHLEPHGGSYLDGYSDSFGQAPSMERSVSDSSQAYLTPPTTHQTRFRSSRRKAATRGRYREYDEDEDEEDEYEPEAGEGGDDDDDYVEGADPEIGNKGRRGAVSVPNSSRVSRQLRYPGGHVPSSHRPYEQQDHMQHRQEQQQYDGRFAPPPAQQHHFQRLPDLKQEYASPQMHSSLSSYPMNPSYTAPIPQYEFDPHSHDSPAMGFAAPPLRRASSFSTLENNANHFSASAGPIQSFHQHQSQHLGGAPDVGGSTIGLGLSTLGSPFTPELHERRLSEMHNSSLSSQHNQGPTYSYDVFNEFAPPPLPSGTPGAGSSTSDPLPLPSPTSSSFTSFARPLSSGNTPRRGSIGFPALPSYLTNGQSHSHQQPHPQQQRATYAHFEGGPSPSSNLNGWSHPQPLQARGNMFSTMTNRLLDRSMEGDDIPEHSAVNAYSPHHQGEDQGNTSSLTSY